MNIQSIALKNIARRKGKTVLTVAGLAIGVASLAAILTLVISFQKGIDNRLDDLGYNVVVHPSSSNLSLNFGGITVSGVDTYETASLSERDVERVRRIEGRIEKGSIRAVSPKLLHSVRVDESQFLIAGSDLRQEAKVKTWWNLRETGSIQSSSLIAGSDVAGKLALSKGDTIKLGHRVFTVFAVLPETGGQDDGIMFADIGAVQQLSGRAGEVSVIEVAAGQSADINEVVKVLKEALPRTSVTSIKQAVEYKEKAVGSLASFGLMVTAVIVLISGVIVFVTISSSVSNRKREIGVFRAIGYRGSVIYRIILTEALLLSVIAGVIGYGIGFGAVFALPVILGTADLAVALNIPVLLLSIGLAVSIGLVAGMPPARKAAGMDPADALKSL